MSDLISRQAAIDAVGDVHPLDYNGQAILHRIQQLPSAEKHGKWETEVRTIRGHKIPFFACSVCGKNADGEYRYCPNCGAKMERSNE